MLERILAEPEIDPVTCSTILNPIDWATGLGGSHNNSDIILSHNNPCFPCNIAITNFLILYMCEIRFYDVIDRTVYTFTSWRHLTQKFQNMAKWVCFGPLFFNLIRVIQLCDKKNLTFIDWRDKILLNSSCKTLLSLPKAHLITFSKTRLIKF